MNTIFEKQFQRWAEIMHRVGDYYDQLDDISALCGELEEVRQHLKRVDWSKVSSEKREEILLDIKEHTDFVKEQTKEMEAQFHLLCDFMEEALFSFISSSKQANQFDNEECQQVVRDELIEYRIFALTVKDRFGFERTGEQKAKRTQRLKELTS